MSISSGFQVCKPATIFAHDVSRKRERSPAASLQNVKASTRHKRVRDSTMAPRVCKAPMVPYNAACVPADTYRPPMPLPYEPQPSSPMATLLILIGLGYCITLSTTSRSVEVPSKYLQIAGLVVNIASVAVPGRFDDDANMLISSPWPTLFSPAGFAFAIWAVIYLGELLGVIMIAALPANDVDHTQSARAWLCANLAQALWCVSFRPWSLGQLWLPSLCECRPPGVHSSTLLAACEPSHDWSRLGSCSPVQASPRRPFASSAHKSS